MDTDLVGYLLGNLDADARRRVEARLRRDPRARAALARARRDLGPLTLLRSPCPPPPGLARRTLARLTAHRQLPAAPPLPAGQRTWPQRLLPRADLVVAVLAAVVVLACLLPWLAACRRQAQVRDGQEKLARIWSALQTRTDTHDAPPGLAPAFTPELLAHYPDYTCPRAADDPNGLDDRWPLLLERTDPEGPGARNVLFAGGQVGWYDPATAFHLSSALLISTHDADAPAP